MDAGTGVEAARVLQALAGELSRMEASGRSLEGLIARLAAHALGEDGVVEGLQAIDELIQCMGALSQFIGVVSQIDAHIDTKTLQSALDGVKLDELRRRLEPRDEHQGGGEDVQASGDVDFF